MEYSIDILYVEHDDFWRRQTITLLKSNGFTIRTTRDYSKLGRMCQKFSPQILLIELKYENKNGIKIIENVKKQCETLPIVLYSSCQESEIIAQVYEIGIDDYISKECDLKIFVSKLKNMIRHYQKNSGIQKISNDTTFNQRTQVLIVKGQETKLKPTDARLLKLLCSRLNVIAESDYLCRGMWNITGKEAELRRYVLHLRKLLNPDTTIKIENNWGGSYRLKCDHPEE